MRIALQFELPTLLDGTLEVAPHADVVILAPDIPLEHIGPVDVVLATPGGSDQLARLLEVSPQLEWVHILGTRVDNYPMELLARRLVTCSKGATAPPLPSG